MFYHFIIDKNTFNIMLCKYKIIIENNIFKLNMLFFDF